MRAICDGDQSRTTTVDLEDSNMRARAARARRARARNGIFERKIFKEKKKSPANKCSNFTRF
jgi:hypothetical protein